MIATDTVPTIVGANISLSWAKAFIKCLEAHGGVLSPAIVHICIEDAESSETSQIREIVEKQLQSLINKPAVQSVVETVAGTIFPSSVWRLSNGDRLAFYKRYESMLPFIRRKKGNRLGTYFQRMISYVNHNEEKINQLEHIIDTWHSGCHRHSALQAGIFDPRVDHSKLRRQGFPCLQQVVFYPKGSNGRDGLSVVAFYANQTLIEKAYGNYLGLYRLGLFMANEMGLELKKVVCIASALKLSDKIGKSDCLSVAKAIRAELRNA